MQISHNEKNLIKARKLQKEILNKSKFSDWIKRNIERNNLKENQDYFIETVDTNFSKKVETNKLEYFLTEEAAIKIILSQRKTSLPEKIQNALETNEEMLKFIKKITRQNDYTKITIIKSNDKKYPEQLLKIKNPPKQLFLKGNIENLNYLGIAIIGTRYCSNYGRKVCKLFTNNLVGYDLNIISGLAVGTDACAHKSCLEAKGKTIAVLPSGFNKVFPKENEGLLEEIIQKGGTVITEYPPDFEKTQESCRERNRIMSGLAIGTLVIEAQKRSGTSITVGYANEQGKKAYAIPSSIYNSKGIGTNIMIKEGKTKMVTSVEDIIKDYPELNLKKREDFEFKDLKTPSKTKQKFKSKKQPKEEIIIDEENLEIYNIIKEKPIDINHISRILNKPISEVTYKVMILEIDGVIKQLEDKTYTINKEEEE